VGGLGSGSSGFAADPRQQGGAELTDLAAGSGWVGGLELAGESAGCHSASSRRCDAQCPSSSAPHGNRHSYSPAGTGCRSWPLTCLTAGPDQLRKGRREPFPSRPIQHRPAHLLTPRSPPVHTSRSGSAAPAAAPPQPDLIACGAGLARMVFTAGMCQADRRRTPYHD
jgi:hypothetical protein